MRKVNVNGGAIALRHPIGASGGCILVTQIYERQRRSLRKDLANLCVGVKRTITLARSAHLEEFAQL
ncbi:hypothetical protein FJU30_18040 [Affinibrenneria salicis]|uniref:Thiolase C-terminal domain-containing protein n=1 Tax=Affinibrenneria salicis TaxID=2590031 RepID=A0A5J5FVI6_9GAMM|nr:hypothetical protein [Affinibrenneria salicis]KAA8997663.1 hypothetical protein FJU30_18040 [Affinibrenneria salicis]